jgi:hypothetical protein
MKSEKCSPLMLPSPLSDIRASPLWIEEHVVAIPVFAKRFAFRHVKKSV